MNRFINHVLLFSFLTIFTIASSGHLFANNEYIPFATSIDTSYKSGDYDDFEPELDENWQDFYDLLNNEKSDLNFDRANVQGEIKILEGYKVKKFSVEAAGFKRIFLSHERLCDAWIFDKLIKAGAVKYNADEDNAVFYLKKGVRAQYWISLEKQGDSYDLLAYYNNLFNIGDEFVVTLEDVADKNGLYYFVTDSVPSKSLSFKVNLEGDADSSVMISCGAKIENGKLVVALDRCLTADGLSIKMVKSNRYVFDNIPVFEGQVFWEIDFKADKPVESVKIKIETNGEIASVKYGEKPGMLKLIGAPSDIGAVMVSSSGQTFLHPEIDSSRLKSPVADEDGNYVFIAPPDLYCVSFGESEYLYDLNCKYLMNLIPVNSGEVTTISLPDEVKNAIRELRNEFVNTEEKTPGSMTINDVRAKNESAEVEIVIKDPLERDVFPELQDISISENGVKGKVKDIQRETALTNIVLLLDTSGSMGENLKPAVEAAKSFVSSLNDKSDISLIQFAQNITVHKGNTKNDVLKSLDTLKSIGATALYDAVAQALKLLKGKNKPFIVLFSDGADSREPGIEGKGSDLTQDQIIKQIAQSNATVLTIGFGKGHDPKVLQAMSNASKNGAYVAARDKTALPAAFAKVASKFGNRFNITYERPYVNKDIKSDIPVVSIMMDLSGSMDTSPDEDPEDDLDYRIDKIKYVFHDFIITLPEKTLMLFQSFTSTLRWSEIFCRQALTSDKPAILQAIADCTALGGTPINQAIKVALANLQTVNSSKRVLVFFTDAALDTEWKNDESGSTKLEYERLLETAKNEVIRMLFAGLGGKAYINKYEATFKNAAELSGGDYVITANPDDILAKLNELLKKVEEPVKKSKILRFNIALNCKAEDGSRMDYAAGKSIELAPLEKTGKILEPAPVKVTTGEKISFYNQKAAQNLYGLDESNFSTRILNHQTFTDVSGSNKLADIKINEMYIMSSFKALQPYESSLLAVNMDINFNKKDKNLSETSYLIPNLFSHFFVSVNEKPLQPASKLTWLAEKPITKVPGKVDIQVSENDSAKGMMLFEILLKPENDDPLTHLSMHFYDNNSGNIEIPIIGKMSSKISQITSLPTLQPQKISDAFSVEVKGYSDVKELCGVSFIHSEISESFRIIEVGFKSNVMALLNIDPMQRFYYACQTDNGMLMSRMSNAVYMMPLGFSGKTMFAPGADTEVRMPFLVSDKLRKAPGYIIADLQDASHKFQVTGGEEYKTVRSDAKFSHEYFDLFINSVAYTDDSKRTIVVDFSIEDKFDGMGTGGIDSLLLLKNNAGNKMILYPDMNLTSRYVYGASDKTGMWSVLDGQKRRGLLFFTPPFEQRTNWELSSTIVKGVKISLKDEVYRNTALLLPDEEPQIDSEYENALEKAVNAAIIAHRANRTEAENILKITLSEKDAMPNNIAIPSFSGFGGHKIKTVKSEKEFYDLMNTLRVVRQETPANIYKAEAVITQGWGSEPEIVRLAVNLLRRLGYESELRTVKLTEAGLEALKNKAYGYSAGVIMQAIEYTDEKGFSKLFVPGFAQNSLALKKFYTVSDKTIEPVNVNTFELERSVSAKPLLNTEKMPQQTITSDIFGALAGESEDDDSLGVDCKTAKKIILFKKQISADVFSTDAIDISYVSIGKSSDGNGDIICAVIDSAEGIQYDTNYRIDTSAYEPESVTIKIGSTYKSKKLLTPKQKLNELFQTLAFALPEITSDAAGYFQKMIAKEASIAEKHNNYERAKWHGHAAVARFISLFTAYSKNTAEKLGVKAFRAVPDMLIGLVVNMLSDGKKVQMSIDLMNHRNMVIETEDENKTRAFNLMTGFFASQLEGEILEGGISYVNVWAALPDSAGFLCIDNNNKDKAVEVLGQHGFPKILLNRMRENVSERCFIIPTHPGKIGGENRWAWLELDSVSFDIVSVFDDGERAGMASYIIGMTPKSSVEFAVGAMIGISCSNMAVAAYSLETADSKAIAQNAAALAIYAYQRVAALQGALPESDSILEAAKNAATGMANDAVKERTGVDAKAIFDKINGEEIELTFSDGFKSAIEAYFKVSVPD